MLRNNPERPVWMYAMENQEAKMEIPVYSCPMDAAHLWTALRYTELNPVRAGMIADAAGWPWSSAAAWLRKKGAVRAKRSLRFRRSH